MALGLAPSAAEACAVCFSTDGASRTAFLATTVLLSVLPLALVGGFAWWLHRRAHAMRQLERRTSGVHAGVPASP